MLVLPTIFETLVWKVSLRTGLNDFTISSKKTAAKEFKADESVLKRKTQKYKVFNSNSNII